MRARGKKKCTPHFFFELFFFVHEGNSIRGRKYAPIKLKCPPIPISSSTFVSFKVILFTFDFFQGYVLFSNF